MAGGLRINLAEKLALFSDLRVPRGIDTADGLFLRLLLPERRGTVNTGDAPPDERTRVAENL